MAWLVIGMCLFRDQSMKDLVATVDLALPGSRGVRVAPSSHVHARDRLGDEPLRWLFERTAEAWAHQRARRHAWRGLAVHGADGTTVDRLFLTARPLLGIERGGVESHWLTRTRSTSTWQRVARLAPVDELVEMRVSSEAWHQAPSRPETWRMRAIRYRRRSLAEQTLLASLVDAKRYPAAEIVALYDERRESERGYNEVKRVMLAREKSTRSKGPRGVAQEW